MTTTGRSICTVENKIISVNGSRGYEMLDLSERVPEWRLVSFEKNYFDGPATAVIDKKIYAMGGYTTRIKMYNLEEGR